MSETATPNPNPEVEREIAGLENQRRLEAAQAALAKERLKNQTELETARAGLVAAYGLPSFEGKTTLETGAGAIEAAILATEAVDAAANRIVEDVERILPSTLVPRRVLILAADESLDFGRAAAIRAEIRLFETIFNSAQALEAAPRSREFAATLGLAAPVAAIKAIAGLLRTETKLSAVDHTATFSHRVLATAVAGRLGRDAYLPSAASDGAGDDSQLGQRLWALASSRDEVAAVAQALQPPQSVELNASVARFDAFLLRVTSPDPAGRVPLVDAARLETLSGDNSLVLRVYVEKAGGSLINRTNFWTFFGFDPVKVSGGLVVSYALTDPRTGRVLAARVLSGRTHLSSLRKIQSGGLLRRAARAVPDLFRTPPRVVASRLAITSGRSTMQYKITVKPDDGRRAGWEAHYYATDGITTVNPEIRHIAFDEGEEGKYSATIDLSQGRYCLACDVVGPGRKIQVAMEPATQIVQAPSDEWPVSAEVPDLMQRDLVPIYFDVGEGQ